MAKHILINNMVKHILIKNVVKHTWICFYFTIPAEEKQEGWADERFTDGQMKDSPERFTDVKMKDSLMGR